MNSQSPLTPGADARLLLSFGKLSRSLPRAICVLDIAPGSGDDLLLQAALQGDVLFTGIDCRESAISEARKSARATGLENVELELVDFSQPASIQAAIDVPEGGFDIIQITSLPRGCGGLASLLGSLDGLLAEHGVMHVRLPGRKQHFDKVAKAIAGARARGLPMAERLEAARTTVDRLVAEQPDCVDWRRASLVGDTEFVDRYMQDHNEHTSVASVFDALAETGMTFLRWSDQAAWSFETLELDAAELDGLRSQPLAEQFSLVEERRNPEQLDFVIGTASNAPRERFDLTKAGETHFMVHPEAVFSIETKNSWGSTQFDHLTVRRGNEDAVEVRPSPAQTALFALREQREPFSGLNLVEVMTADGASLEDALLALHQLVGMDLLYRPHEFDVAQFYAAMIAKPSPVETPEMVVTPSLPQKNSHVPAAGEPAAPLPAQREQPASVAPNLHEDGSQDA